jgi:hypothetical protein
MAFNPAELESQRLKAAAFDTKRNQRAAHFDWKVEENYYSDISGLTTAASPVTLFTVTGLVECKIVGVGGALTSASNTGTLAVGVTGATTLGLGTTTIDTTNFPTGGAIWIDTSPTLLGEAIVATNLTGFLTNSNIILTIATNNMLTGALRFLCAWRPWSSDGSVVSARSGG